MGIEKNTFLNIFPYFKTVREELVEEIISVSRHKKISGRLQLKKEGDTLTDFVFLLAGEKRVYKTNNRGREITLYEMEKGDICVLNVVCILSNSRLPANAESLNDIEMLLIAADDFKRIMVKYDEMRMFVYGRIIGSLVTIMSLISEITFTKVDERLIDYLFEKSENGRINQTHRTIANDLGTSREVVSRLLKDLERKGLVELSRNRIELREGFLP